MLKRVLPLCILLVLMLQSCSPYGLPRNLQNNIDFVYIENEDGRSTLDHVVYMDTVYYPHTKTFSHAESLLVFDESDITVLLGWSALFDIIGVGYVNYYCSYQKDAPVYIYEKRIGLTYLRSDYNLFADSFVIADTTEEMILSDVLQERIGDLTAEEIVRTDVLLRSKAYPMLKVPLEVFEYNGDWYAVSENVIVWYSIDEDGTYVYDLSYVYTVSDEFVEILRENNLIPLETE